MFQEYYHRGSQQDYSAIKEHKVEYWIDQLDRCELDLVNPKLKCWTKKGRVTRLKTSPPSMVWWLGWVENDCILRFSSGRTWGLYCDGYWLHTWRALFGTLVCQLEKVASYLQFLEECCIMDLCGPTYCGNSEKPFMPSPLDWKWKSQKTIGKVSAKATLIRARCVETTISIVT